MLCSFGKELKRVLDAATNDLAKVKQVMADTSVSFVVRDRRFQKAQEQHHAAGKAFLDHKAGCSTCRVRDSAIRPRFSSPS